MSILKVIIGTIYSINKWLGEILSYFLFVIFVLLMMEVIRRYFFNSPTVWANELTQMLFGS